MPTIDFTKAIQDARGASFEALPIGDYDIEVAKAEAVTSSNGKPMIKVNMKVISGPYEKRSILNNFVLSLENAQATAIFFRHMKAFGLTEEWFASLGQAQSLDPVASALVGRRARLSVGHREWQGEMRNEVKGVKPYTGAPGPASGGPVGPAGPMAPAGPAALPPRPAMPVAAPVAPPAPVTPPPPPPAPVAPAPVAPPVPAAVADAPPLPQVQGTPQPPAVPVAPEAPAPVPTPATYPASTESTGYAAVASSPAPQPVATSEVAAPAPPQLPF